MISLKETTVLITGASHGLGSSLASIFAKEGARLILTGRDKKPLEELRDTVDVPCQIVAGDLTESKTIKELQRIATKEDVEILVNNAGALVKKLLEDTTKEEIDKIISINLKAPILLTQALLPHFKKRKGGIIVNISSTAGKGGVLHHTIYCATKYGINGFSDALRMEANPHGIRVITACPGGMKTNLFRDVKDDLDRGKFMDPNEVAKIIVESCKSDPDVHVNEILIKRPIQ